MRVCVLLVNLAIAALIVGSEPASAGDEPKIALTKALYYDCAVSSDAGAGESIEIDISYFDYADGKPAPQVNFNDPANVFYEKIGWAPKNAFVLTKLLSNGRLYLWQGSRDALGYPEVKIIFELVPDAERADHAQVQITRFELQADKTPTEFFGGDCTILSGEAAYYRFLKGGSE